MERIEASAIKFQDAVWTVPRPGRHHDVISYVLRERPWIDHVGGEQGFWTSEGRFVDRQTARKLAEAADQIIPSVPGPDGVPFKRDHDELFSEDVW